MVRRFRGAIWAWHVASRRAENKAIEQLDLTRARTAELTAVLQFRLRFRFRHDRGTGNTVRSLVECDGEIEDAGRLTGRIIFLDGTPGLELPNAHQAAKTPKETVNRDLAVEHHARAHDEEAREYCRDAGDYV